MLRDDFKQLKTGQRELRNFGLLVGAVFGAIGLVLWARHRPAYPYLLAPGLLLVILGATVPRMLKPVYLVWMGFALLLGFIVSHVILALFFFFVITPVGLLARIAGKDFLRLKLDRTAPSYWIKRDRPGPLPPTAYQRQF